MAATAVGTVMALFVGWLAGMVTHKRAEHWCPVDGATLRCPECANMKQSAAQSSGSADPTTEAATPPSTMDGAA